VLNGPSAASMSMIGLMTSESTRCSWRGCQDAKSVLILGAGTPSAVGETIVTELSSSKLGLKSSKPSSEDESVSSLSITASGCSGVDALRFDFLLCFPFLGMIEFAHDFTFRGLLLDFLDLDLTSSFDSALAGDVNGDELKVVVRAGSDMLVGSLR